MLNELLNKLKELITSINLNGVPLPLARDPKTKIGSVSLTLVFISSIMVILGLIDKGKLSVVDIENALEFFYASSFLYFGRNWRTGASTSSEKTSGGSSKTKDELPPKKG